MLGSTTQVCGPQTLGTVCEPTCSMCPGGPASPAARRCPGALAECVPACAAAMPAETAAALAAMVWRCEADRNTRGWYRGGAGAAASAVQANAVNHRAVVRDLRPASAWPVWRTGVGAGGTVAAAGAAMPAATAKLHLWRAGQGPLWRFGGKLWRRSGSLEQETRREQCPAALCEAHLLAAVIWPAQICVQPVYTASGTCDGLRVCQRGAVRAAPCTPAGGKQPLAKAGCAARLQLQKWLEDGGRDLHACRDGGCWDGLTLTPHAGCDG